MNMLRVTSSNVHSVGYTLDGEMHVKFNSGGIYRYTNVPEAVYRQFFNAASKGTYFKTYISGKYGETKIF